MPAEIEHQLVSLDDNDNDSGCFLATGHEGPDQAQHCHTLVAHASVNMVGPANSTSQRRRRKDFRQNTLRRVPRVYDFNELITAHGLSNNGAELQGQ